jgi:periplasmic divalent cation tolerance protein
VTGCCQVSTTVADESGAASLAEALVAERLAACVQVMGPVRSTYRWKQDVQRETEWLVTARTTDARTDALIARIRAMHPYENPEIIALPITGGSADYLSWIHHETD